MQTPIEAGRTVRALKPGRGWIVILLLTVVTACGGGTTHSSAPPKASGTPSSHPVSASAGSSAASGQVKLPQGFPTGAVPLPPGSRILSATDLGGVGYIVAVAVKGTDQSVVAAYQDQLKAAGYQITQTMNQGNGSMVQAASQHWSILAGAGTSQDSGGVATQLRSGEVLLGLQISQVS